MDILGIHPGHNATACLLRNGRLVAAASEERFTRVKNIVGVPERSASWIRQAFNPALAAVAVAGTMPSFALAATLGRGNRADPWGLLKRTAAVAERRLPLLRVVNDAAVRALVPRRERRLAAEADRAIAERLGIEGLPIRRYDHHRCHAATSYYGLGCTDGPWLVLTADGGGDLTSSTVHVGRDGELTEIARTSDGASVGGVYTAVTEFLGLKPVEDEHKVMGLAPYAMGPAIEAVRKRLAAFLELDAEHLTFRSRHRTYGLEVVRPLLAGSRFDVAAAAVQRWLEDLMSTWVVAAVRRTGIRSVAVSGGVFLNVKLNLRLAELAEVERLAVFPSGGDESIAIGAAFLEYRERSGRSPDRITDLYLGPEYGEQEIDAALERYRARERWRVERPVHGAESVAELLERGEVVARFGGRMEWGARALGNRSILARPDRPTVIRTINEQIKGRDFWMPFAPSILAKRAGEYLVNPRGLSAPYMVLAFRSTERARKDLAAALHPYDFTLRPQVVEASANPPFHALLAAFARRTGIGGLLNTSFNLHGEPIVGSPDDALSTFERSGLRHLALGPYLIEKRP